jgi:N-acetylmuramic acid 6-phosphate etherase
MNKVTEQESLYHDLDKMSTRELLENINREDQKIALVIQQLIPRIEKLVDVIVDKMLTGGRLFYIGAGTSGRLGIVDASECPPTFGVPQGLVVGLIAGGDTAIRKAVELAEDNREQGWKDLKQHDINSNDVLIGIAASGTTPYIIGVLEKAQQNNIVTGCIVCNEKSPVAKHADHPIVAVVGPEFVTGSTRMKAGTAQKLILNMISTSVMIKLGRVKGNRMVDMQLTNDKLVDRGTKMVMEQLNVSYEKAKELLLKHGTVRKTVAHNQ